MADENQPIPAGGLEDRGMLRLEEVPFEDDLFRAARKQIDRIISTAARGEDGSARLGDELRTLDAFLLLVKASGYDHIDFEIDCRATLDRLAAKSASSPRLLKRVLDYRSHLGQFTERGDWKEVEAVKARALEIWSGLPRRPSTSVTPQTSIDGSERREMRDDFCELTYAEGRNLFMEQSFAEEMLRSWNEPLLTTTAHAVETLHMLARREARIVGDWCDQSPGQARRPPSPGFRVEEHVLRFAGSCFDETTGVFRDPNSEQELYATSSGIAIFKAHLDIGCSERADEEQLSELLWWIDERGKRRRINPVQIRDAAGKRLDTILNARRNKSHSRANNALVEVNHALRIIWNLSADLPDKGDGLIRELRPRLTEFLLSCHRKKRIQLDGATNAEFDTFVMSPRSEAACMTACLAALRIAEHALLSEHDLNDRLRACGRYVAACRREGSGFGSSIRHTPDVLHTYMALAARSLAVENAQKSAAWRDALGAWDFIDDQTTEELVHFFELCHKDDGGYALIPEWMPSAYATRLAFQSFGRLDLPVVGAWKIRDFIHKLLAPKPDGTAGYTGYPAETYEPASSAN